MNALATILAEYDLFMELINLGYLEKETVIKITAITMEKVNKRMDILFHMDIHKHRIERIMSYRPNVITLLDEASTWMENIRAIAEKEQ